MLQTVLGNGNLTASIRCQGNRFCCPTAEGGTLRRRQRKGNILHNDSGIIIIHLFQRQSYLLVADGEARSRGIQGSLRFAAGGGEQIRRTVGIDGEGNLRRAFVAIRGLGFCQPVGVPRNDAFNGDLPLPVLTGGDGLRKRVICQFVVTSIRADIRQGELRAGKLRAGVLADLLDGKRNGGVLHRNLRHFPDSKPYLSVPVDGEGYRVCDFVTLGGGVFHQMIGFGRVTVVRRQTVDGDGSVSTGSDGINGFRCVRRSIEEHSLTAFTVGTALVHLKHRASQILRRLGIVGLVEGHLIFGIVNDSILSQRHLVNLI